MNAKWSVLAVYEDSAAQQIAMQFCDGLVQRFWPELSFELSWYNWSDLEKPVAAKEAALKAGEADIIIMVARGAIKPQVCNWVESALRRRGEREGFLVGLPVSEAGLPVEAAATQQYLRKLAHHRGLDYLIEVPHSLPHQACDSVESYQLRATQVTSVLDTILHQSPPPPRLL